MYDVEQLLKMCVERYDQGISRDYFIYHAFHYEFCINTENSKKFVVTTPWLEQQELHEGNFEAALRTMSDWYAERYSVFTDTQVLTFARFYHFLPVLIAYVHEARTLWEKFSGVSPPVYDVEKPFWRELLRAVQDKCKHQHLIIPWLQWRYSERVVPSIAVENLPPNPFVERRSFGRRDRRDGGERKRRESGARRPAGGREAAGRAGRAGASRGQGKPRERGRGFPRAGGREERGARVVTTLTAAMTSEIKQAVAMMQDDDAHPGVTLKPANSYYRRLQHKMVANLGFTSISVGEEREQRAVKIVRGS